MIGRTIGNFVVTREIGAGGMGTVYAATHPRMGKRVAVKVLRAEHGANLLLARRFLTEARAVARIRSEHVVDVLDFGELPDGTCYLVMELLDGRSVRRAIEQDGIFPPARAVHVGIGVLQALVAAHAVGVVHRDLKPDNLFLIRRGRDPDFVKVLDFGIARLRTNGDNSVSDDLRTHTGAIIGTPAYMAPEQCRGAHREIDARTDLYSLGIILYQLVTGRRPFAADHVGDLLLAQMTMEPEPPRAIKPDVPAALEEVILRVLRKAPEERFQGAVEMAHALAESIGISVTIDMPPSVPDQIHDGPPVLGAGAVLSTRSEEEAGGGRPSRRKALLLVGGSMALVAMAAGGVAAIKAGRPGPIESKPTPPATLAIPPASPPDGLQSTVKEEPADKAPPPVDPVTPVKSIMVRPKEAPSEPKRQRLELKRLKRGNK